MSFSTLLEKKVEPKNENLTISGTMTSREVSRVYDVNYF